MKKLPYEDSVTVQAILKNNDLSIDEKAARIHKHDYDMACRCSDLAGVKASMSVDKVRDILVEMEMEDNR